MNKKVILNISLYILGAMSAMSWVHFRTSNSVQTNQPTYTQQSSPQELQNALENYRHIISDKDRKINELKKQLANISRSPMDDIATLTETTNPLSQDSAVTSTDSKLKKMTMKDFEESMKTSFVDRFKGVILELSGSELDNMKKSFTASSDKNDWSNKFESSISNFLTENDPNGDHFIQGLSCNTNICRLEVNTNNSESWDTLYASMTQQPWYNTITLQENSDYPGSRIYYLPSINN